MPEIGGMLAKSLNLQDSPEMRNYFTDWLLTGAPNNNSAEAKDFQQAARNNPAMFEILQKIRDEFEEFQSLAPEERIAEKIIDKPPEKILAEHLGYYKDNAKEEFIDNLHPIERMFEQVVAKAEKTNPKLAKWLKETVNPYEMARLLRGMDSVANIMVGTINISPSKRINEIRASLAQAYPNVNFSRFKPIAMILEETGALNDKKTRRLFESFCVAKLGDVWSPIQKIIANTNSFIKQSERNKVKCQIAQLARCGQFGQIIAETDNPHPNTGTAISFYEFGKKHWLETPDPSIVRALSAIQSQKDGAWIVKAFNAVMSWFKSLITYRNLDFAIGNIFHDSAAAYIHNKHLGYANPFLFMLDIYRILFLPPK